MTRYQIQRRSTRHPQWAVTHECKVETNATAFLAWCETNYGPLTRSGARFGVEYRLATVEA